MEILAELRKTTLGGSIPSNRYKGPIPSQSPVAVRAPQTPPSPPKGHVDVNYHLATRVGTRSKQVPVFNPPAPAKQVPASSTQNMEEVIQQAFPQINLSHSPPTPGRSAPVSKRPNRAAAAATAAASVIPVHIQSDSGSFVMNIQPGQNDPFLKPLPRPKIPIPENLKCENCGFQSTTPDGFKTHRSRGCGPTPKKPCPYCGKMITTGNSGHIKKCKTDQEKLARKNQK